MPLFGGRYRFGKLAACATAGTFAGISLGLLPHLGIFSEVRNFQIFLLEMSYQGLTRCLSPAVMRGFATTWGELTILGAIGTLIGLAVGVLVYGLAFRVSHRWRLSAIVVSLSAIAGVFVTMFGILWCRTVLIHSSTRRMASPEGFGMVLGSLGMGLLAGLGCLLVLRWLARYRLEKVSIVVGFFLLLGGYLDSSVGGAVPTVSQHVLPSKIEQVVFLGVDGATWDVALPLVKEGKLPNLAALMERGAWGDLRTTIPWKSPILWASIATGKREDQHGIQDFVVRDQAAHTVLPVSIASRKVKAIWDIVSEAGLHVDVVNWYGSRSAEAINGTMVSYRFMRQDLLDRVFPQERTREIDELLEALEAGGTPRNETMATEIGLHLLEQDQADLHLSYLREIDDLQHFFWRQHAARRDSLLAWCLYGSIDEAELAEKGRRIEEAYERFDATLGRILQLVGPQTAIVVASDHGGGIKSLGELRFSLNPVLEQWGLLRYLPDGKTINWTDTQLYDATKRPWYEQRELFINQRSEGPFNQASSEEAQRHLLEYVVKRLKQLRTVSGKPVVRNVWIRRTDDETMHVVARVNVKLKANDTVQGLGLTLPVSSVVWRTDLTGTHRLHGILVMAGPGIKSGYRLRAASILDITPTLLYLLGMPVANDMEGRVLLEAVEQAVRRTKPPRMIPTYETGVGRAALKAKQSEADEELLEQLRSLGYIQ